MIWFTWRQHRIEAVITGGLLLLISAVLIYTGLVMRDLYNQMGVAKCLLASGNCAGLLNQFTLQAPEKSFGNSTFFNFFIMFLSALPLLVGLFIGAPAGARDLEQRAYQLIWTQSISRQRWFTTKVCLLVAALLCGFACLILLSHWWMTPLDHTSNFIWQFYDIQGPVLPASMLFAFALGFVLGQLIRRTVPAMAIVLVVFLILRITIEVVWRPYFVPPLNVAAPFGNSQNMSLSAQVWVVDQGIFDRQGKKASISEQLVCSNTESLPDQYNQCMDTHGFQWEEMYQPANRFWLFQGIESGLYLLLSGFLLFFAYWWIKRKIV